jgi:hypothetical protein
MNLFKSIMNSVVAKGAQRFFYSIGRGNEKILSKQNQHYGFRSVPPEGTELINIEDGNLCYTVAENDGNSVEPGDVLKLETGEVAIYTSKDNFVNIVPEESGNLTGIYVKSDRIVNMSAATVLVESNPNGMTALYLVKASYLTALETQLGLIATSLNTLGQPVAPFIRPANSVTTVLKAE